MSFSTSIQAVRARDGLALSVERATPNADDWRRRTPLLCLAGLTRNRRDFYDLRDHFAGHPEQPRQVVMLDARGRGASEYAPDASSYTVQQEADDVLQVCTALGIEHAILVGTSRGGILAMIIALVRGGMIRATVLNDIGPEIASAGLLRLKQQLGDGPVEPPESWPEAEQRLREALGPQFPAFSDDDWTRAARLTFNEKNGRPERAYDPRILDGLAAVSAQSGPIALWAPFQALARAPVMIVRGELSDLLDTDVAQRAVSLAQQKSGGVLEIVPGQGHAPALRGPVLDVMQHFFEAHSL